MRGGLFTFAIEAFSFNAYKAPPKKKYKSNNKRNHTTKTEPQRQRKTYSVFNAREMLINSMSNWQRSAWAKDGYKESRILHFTQLKRTA